MDYNFTFPSLRGYQSNREYFSIMCPLGLLSKIFSFYNEEIPPEYRAQRLLNEKRIPEIKDYILQNPNDYIFSSITASIDGEYSFESFTADSPDIGLIKISMDSRLLINDGQHRKAAIDAAILESPELKSESISVVLFVDQGLSKSQQMFSDLNLHAVNVSPSLGILYDQRSIEARFTKDLLEKHSIISRFVDMSSRSLAQKSNKLFILNSIHSAIMMSIKGVDLKTDDESKRFIEEYWFFLFNNFIEWQFVIKKEVSAYHARQSSVASYGVVLDALGSIGYYMLKNKTSDWKNTLLKLNEIDWSKSNLNNWMIRCISPGGAIDKSGRKILLTTIKIKSLIQLSLTEEEALFEDRFLEDRK